MDLMPRKKYKDKDFQKRLAELRKARGLTQVQLAKAIGSTQRAISHYEKEAAYPPAPVVVKLAKALKVSTDELLGVSKMRVKTNGDATTRRLWKKFQQVQDLPVKDQRAIIRMVNSLVAATEKR